MRPNEVKVKTHSVATDGCTQHWLEIVAVIHLANLPHPREVVIASGTSGCHGDADMKDAAIAALKDLQALCDKARDVLTYMGLMPTLAEVRDQVDKKKAG